MPDFLLLQMRNEDDTMLRQEHDCFCEALQCNRDALDWHNLIDGPPTSAQLQSAKVILIGGSGDYSIAEGGEWLDYVMETMRRLCEESHPTFASCWGFQAMALAMGGKVVTDLSLAELGMVPIRCTEEAGKDPIYSAFNDFLGAQGHQDIVVELPDNATLLASSATVRNQAFRFNDKPIYCTQFHPELSRRRLIERLYAYPQYVERISGITIDQFVEQCPESTEPAEILRRFVREFARSEVG